MKTVPITYFSDILCIWAYIAQFRVNELKAAFGDQIRIEPRFCSVFGATARKMATTWREKGGYEGFNAHLRHVGEQFPEIPVSPDLWLTVRPHSSTGAHLFLKAVELQEAAGQCPSGTTEDVTWALRQAFFVSARDIGRWEVQCSVGEETGTRRGPYLHVDLRWKRLRGPGLRSAACRSHAHPRQPQLRAQ